MDRKIKELADAEDFDSLEKCIPKADISELCNLVLSRLKQSHIVNLIDHVLNGFSNSEQCQSKKRKLVESVFKEIKKSKITSTHAGTLVNRIVRDFPKWTKLHLTKLVDYCLVSIQNNDDEFFCWKDVLPLILQILEEEKYISYKGNEVSGAEYKSLIIKAICSQSWELGILTSLAQMFGEICMMKADLEFAIRALCDKTLEVEPNELPPLVHQLLRLTNNSNGRLVIETLQKYFLKHYSEAAEGANTESIDCIGQVSLKEIQEIESTVLYHIYQSALLNHSSLKEFIRNLKGITHAPEFILNPFSLSVLLLVSNIYEDQIFEIIKQVISRKLQDDEKRKSHAWMKEVLPEKWKVIDIIEQVINNSNKDRHLVLKGLVELSFVLLETGKTRDNEVNKMHEIGMHVIQKLIKKRHEIGSTVLQKLTDKIVSGGTSVSQYTECLAYMCRKSTIIVLDSLVWVSALLDNLLSIPGESATQVLYATLPLMRISPSIRDTLVVILRKALYRKGICVRKMAVTGFLQFLSNLKIAPFSLSQSSSSTNTTNSSSIFTQATVEHSNQSANSKCNASFCQEILGILKKCFSHEYEVRQHLYSGLYDAVCCNSELAEPVIDMLLSHLNNYYENDEDIQPPLNFYKCSSITGSEAVLQEPIGDLVFTLQKIYCKIAVKESCSIDKLALVLASICRRITQTEVGHLGIDDGTDLFDIVPKIQQKVLSIKLMSTVIEALIAYCIGGWSKELTVVIGLNNMFKAYYTLVEFCKRVVKPRTVNNKNKKDPDTTIKKTGGRTGTIKLPTTIIDLEIIKKLLTLLYDSNIAWATREQINLVRKRPEFHKYVLQICMHVFQIARQLKNIERQKYRENQIKNYFDIGEILYKQFIVDLEGVRGFEEDVAILGLECFKDYIDTMYSMFPSELSKYYAIIVDVEVNKGLVAQVSTLIRFLRDFINRFYEVEVDEHQDQEEFISKKIPLLIFEIISLLIKKNITADGPYEETFRWLVEMSKSNKVDDNVAIIIFDLIAIIEDRDEDYGKTLDLVCIELSKKLGTIDNVVISIRESYPTLKEMTMHQVHNIFNNLLKIKLDNSSWVLGRLKAENIISVSPGMGDELHREKIKEKERILCKQLSYQAHTLQLLANSAIDPGPNTEALFKNLHQLYNIMNHLTKYFNNKSSLQNAAFQSVRFIQVVELAGKMLKATFYNLITHTEGNHQSSRKADAQTLRNKVLKETKFIPKVVYEIEQFQKEILALGKKTGVPLEGYIKHSVTRDFRISHPQLVEGLEKLDGSQMNTQATNQHNHSTRDSNLDLSVVSTPNTSNTETDDGGPPRKKSKKSRRLD